MSDVAERLRAVAATEWVHRSERMVAEALATGAAEIERLHIALSGAQYREREALAVAEVLRARLDGAQDYDALHDVLAASLGALDGVGDAGDLAGLGRRDSGEVRQWRGCHRCGRAFLLADTEAVPGHGVTIDGVDRACGAKEGR